MRPICCAIILSLFHFNLVAQCLIEQLSSDNTACCGNTGQEFIPCSSGILEQVEFKLQTVFNNPTSTFYLKTNEGCEVLWTVPNVPVASNSIITISLSSGSGTSRTLSAGVVYEVHLEPTIVSGGSGWHSFCIATNNPYPDGIESDYNCGFYTHDKWFRIAIGQYLPPLPVELVDLQSLVAKNGKDVDLIWQTASESNASHFTIQHATDGENFRDISEIAAHGTTAEAHSYQFTHESPSPCVNYYRLKQVDYDGGFEYSKIIQVHMEKAKRAFRISPNPSDGDIHIIFEEPTPDGCEVKLFGLDGKMVYEHKLAEEMSDWTISGNDLPPGIYYLKMLVGESSSLVEKIVKR